MGKPFKLYEYLHKCFFDYQSQESQSPAILFPFWIVRGLAHYLYNAVGLAPLVCKMFGHKLMDCSSAGPESGNMDYCCVRCDSYWHVPLY
jgi:hypothetical protein